MSGSAFSSYPALAVAQNPTQPVNMLTQASDIVGLQKNMLAIQQQRQNLQSTLAIGRAAQASIGSDGTMDQGKFRSMIANDPDAAWGAQQAIGTSQDQQEEAYKVNSAALGQSTARAGVFSTALTPLLAQGNNVQPADVYGVVARLHAAGMPVDGAVDQIATTLPHQGGAALRQWIAQNATGSGGLPTSDALPKPGFVSTGGAVTGIDENPLSNPGVTSASLPMTMSPGEQVQPVTGPPTASGAPTTIPAAQYASQHGLGGLIPSTGRAPLPSSLVGPGGASGGPVGGMQPSSGQAAPAAQSPFGGGSAWSGSDGSGGGQSSGAQSPFGAPTPTGLGPGQKAGIEAAGNASASQWADLQHQVGGSSAGGGSAGRIYQLQQSLKSLQSLGPQGTGPGAAGMQSVLRYAQSMPFVGGLVSGVTSPDQIANYDLANKYLTAYASSRAGAHGGTTDSQLATTLSSNASTHISNLAAQDVVKANLGLERMDQAQAQAFQQSGQTPDQFANFSANWNRSMDPRAFIADQLTPQQLQRTLGSMSAAERTKFQATYNQAVTNGWMTPPPWAQNGSASVPAAPSGGSASGY